MAGRKKLENKQKFVFDEGDVVEGKVGTGRSSVQHRLVLARGDNMGVGRQLASQQKREVNSLPSTWKTAVHDPVLEDVVSKLQITRTSLPSSHKATVQDPVLKNGVSKPHGTRVSLPSSNRSAVKDPVLKDVVSKQHGTRTSRPSSHKAAVQDAVLEDVVTKLQKLGSRASSWQVAPVQNCPCLRPLRLIMCGECGQTFPARIKVECAIHPRAEFLEDISACRGCHKTDLSQLLEFDLPAGMEQEIKQRK